VKILIDATGFISDSHKRGIGRFTRDFFTELASFDDSINVEILIDTAYSSNLLNVQRYINQKLLNSKIHYWSSIRPTVFPDTIDDYHDFSNKLLQEKIVNINPDVVVFTEHFIQGVNFSKLDLKKTTIKSAVLIYDLIPLKLPSEYLSNQSIKEWYLKRAKDISKADTILTISKSSARDIKGFLPTTSPVNIGCCTTSEFNQAKNQDLKSSENKFNEDFLLYAGGYDKRKGIDMLITTFNDVQKSIKTSIKLILVGDIPKGLREDYEKTIASLNLENTINLVGYISDNELIQFYKSCTGYIHTSEYEGFGLPLLEAMSLGAPIVAAKNSSVEEVVSDCAIYFETGNAASLYQSILKLINDKNIRQNLSLKGIERSKAFSWQSVAHKTLENLTKTVNNKDSLKEIDLFSYEKLVNKLDISSKLNFTKIAKSIAYSFEPDKPKQLLLDVSILVKIDSNSGIQRVTKSLMYFWNSNPPKGFSVNPIYYCNDSHVFKYASIVNSKLLRSQTDLPTDFFSNDIFLGLDLNHDFVVNKSIGYERLLSSRAKVFFILYDLLPFKYPEYFNKGMKGFHQKWLEGIAQADGVISISKTVMNDFQGYIKKYNNPLFNENIILEHFRLGNDIDSFEAEHKPEHQAKTPIECNEKTNILMVGTIEPRKGYDLVVNNFEKLFPTNGDINLIIVGKAGWKTDKIINKMEELNEESHNFYWFSDINDSQLKNLYLKADGYIAASYDEGFGLPIIEAAKYNIPVIARDIPIFKEVGKAHIEYFDNNLVEHSIENIKAWLIRLKEGNVKLPTELKPQTWEDSANELFFKIFN